MRIEEFESLKRIGFNRPKPQKNDFSLIFKLRYGKRFEEIKSLSNLTIGTLLEIPKTKTFREMFDLIKNDLELCFITKNDETLLIEIWIERVDTIQRLFSDIQKKYISNSKYGSIWNKIENLFNVPYEISLIDNISKRDGISWNETQKLKWSEVYFKLLIDKQMQSFQEEISKQPMKV